METLINFTQLENTVLEVIKNGDEFDGMPCECFENVADNTGISKKVLRGVLSSLIQKMQ